MPKIADMGKERCRERKEKRSIKRKGESDSWNNKSGIAKRVAAGERPGSSACSCCSFGRPAVRPGQTMPSDFDYCLGKMLVRCHSPHAGPCVLVGAKASDMVAKLAPPC